MDHHEDWFVCENFLRGDGVIYPDLGIIFRLLGLFGFEIGPDRCLTFSHLFVSQWLLPKARTRSWSTRTRGSERINVCVLFFYYLCLPKDADRLFSLSLGQLGTRMILTSESHSIVIVIAHPSRALH